MPKLLLIFLLTATQFSLFAQVSDIISVKKRSGRTIKSFYESSQIFFQTKDGGYIEGPIAKINHDSIYIRMYTIQKGISSFGAYVFDTLNTFLVNASYKDIRRISVYQHHGSMRQKLGLLMMIGGAGYAALNLLNGSFFNLPITDKKNLKTLGISAAVFGAGFINNKFFAANSFSKKSDRIVYISLNK
ncbi:MAG: hypothetical protein ACHQF0_17350 [Chitinophagales bacterium]